MPLLDQLQAEFDEECRQIVADCEAEGADALIAGTCMEQNETLVTANDKHYRVVEGLQMTIFRP